MRDAGFVQPLDLGCDNGLRIWANVCWSLPEPTPRATKERQPCLHFEVLSSGAPRLRGEHTQQTSGRRQQKEVRNRFSLCYLAIENCPGGYTRPGIFPWYSRLMDRIFRATASEILT